jgi:phage shock protein PspC (stress-responsive transcriptional regulator)
MPSANTNLLLRNDTVLGVCEAIGQDFGFHPNWLRLTLASLFYFFPAGVVGTYLALGVAVAFTRWIAPDSAEAAKTVVYEAIEISANPLPIAA